MAPTWDAPDDHRVTGCQMLRRHPSAGESSLSVHAEDTGSDATPHPDTDVVAGTLYVEGDTAINEAGERSKSRRVWIATCGEEGLRRP